ncbi:MAG: hypothetical protein ACR2LL_05285 [Nitrosopumilus sp.]|uniref:hypothetical protein n=1 Tax=Nitrosopumilus sp. TaxID=2024843 RepID=UPI00292D7210|nr:hypothetical protein [Nitrosopumilus sp.]
MSSSEDDKSLTKLQMLIDLKIGDLSRLQNLKTMLEKRGQIPVSDQVYLEKLIKKHLEGFEDIIHTADVSK